MTRKVLIYPDKRLLTKTEPVTEITPEILSIVDELFAIMYQDDGVGLAANQVGILKRILVMDTEGNGKNPLCLINPEIVGREGESTGFEGCLSFPGIYLEITRAAKVHVKATNQRGEPIELHAEGLLARCAQHEIDHLDGKVFVDKISPLKKERALAKMAKMMREQDKDRRS